MRALVQRVSQAGISINGEPGGRIGAGLVILLGITHTDTAKDVDFLVEKCANLRIFEDDAGKMNLSLKDIGGGALIVSQFTLYGDASKGRRPSFTAAAAPDTAEPLYDMFVEHFRREVARVETGSFGADMQVDLVNDGPVTLLVESRT